MMIDHDPSDTLRNYLPNPFNNTKYFILREIDPVKQ